MGELLVGRSAPADELLERLGERSRVVLYGEAGVGKTALVRAVLAGRGYREGGCLATLAWSPYLPLRRAFGHDLPDTTWTGDAEYVAAAVAEALAGETLFVDDVQWADPGSLRVIEVLGDSVPLVLAVRRGDPVAAEVLERLGVAPADRLDLDPLDPDDAADLVRALRPKLGSTDVQDLVRRSGGNPLLIEELADTDRGTESLHLAVLARCRALPDDQLDALALLTVAGRPLPATDVPGADGLVEGGLAVASEGYVTIRHSLVAEVIGDLISEDRERRCHLRLTELLTHPGEVAVHLLAAGEQQAAYDAAMRAVETARTPGERVAHLETAARCVDPETGAEFRLQAAEAANEVDESAKAAALLDDLPDRDDLRFRVSRQRAIIAYFEGDGTAQRAAMDAQVAAARPGTAEEVVTLAELSFMRLVVDGAYDESVALAERAAALAEQVGAGHVAALKAVADSYYLTGDDRWRAAMPAALARARTEGDFAREWRIANNFISAMETYGPQEDALALAAEMRRRCAEMRLLETQRNFEFREVNLAGHACRYDLVLDQAPALLAARGSAEQYVVDLSFTLASAQFDLGMVDEGLATAEGMLARASERARSSYHLVRAWGFLEAGLPDRALDEEPGFRAAELDQMRIALAGPVFAWAALETGADAPPPPPVIPDTGLVSGAGAELAGIAALRAGDPAGAADAFAAAVQGYDGHRRGVVRAGWAYGEALRLAGDPDAEPTLLAAEADARELGLVGVTNRCERSLRAMGVRRSAAIARSSDSPLTAREHEIVLLAAEGLTDKAIAARLGIAHRTVQTLVANARRKVGAENRRHLISLITGAAS